MFQSQLGRSESMVLALGDATGKVVTQSQRAVRAMTVLGATATMIGGIMLGAAYSVGSWVIATERYTTAADVAVRMTNVAAEALAAERDELEELYISSQVANQALGKLAIAQVDITKASDLSSVALDLSTLSVRDHQRVLLDLVESVTSLSTARLREYGIATTATKVYAWFGKTLGKTARQLTTLERRQAMLNYLLTVGTGIQGAWNELIDSAGVRVEIFQFRLAQLKDTFGKHLLPIMSSGLAMLNSLMERFESIPEPVQAVIMRAIALGGAFLVVAGSLTLLLPGLKVLLAAFKALPSLLGMAAGGLATAKTGVLGLVASIASLHPAVLVVIAVVSALAAAVITDFGGLRGLFDRTIGAFLRSMKDAFVSSMPWVRAWVSIMRDGLKILTLAFGSLDKGIRGITDDLVKDDWGFDFDPERFFVGAASLMGGFAAGLIQGFNEYVLPVVIYIVEAMASFLGSSLPTEGPLAKIDTAGMEIIKAWTHGMSEVSLDVVRDLAEEVEEVLTQALYQVQDALYDIETQELKLAKALWPLEDALYLARAAADLVIIPLERQRRVLERQIEDLEEIAAKERERAEAYLRTLEKQAQALRDLIEVDEERLEAIDHEIFMEEQRNKILGRATSARLLQLKSERMAVKDNVDVNRESLDVTEEQISAEEERLEELVTAAEAQIAALQELMDTLAESIEIEEERVRLAQESLRLEEARQAQARLALLEERRFWEEEERAISHLLEIIGRLPAEIAETVKKMKKAREEVQKFIDAWEAWVPKPFEPKVDAAEMLFNLEELKKKLLDAFMKPILEEMKKTDEGLARLSEAWEKLAKVEGVTLERMEKNFKKWWNDRLVNVAKNQVVLKAWFKNWWDTRKSNVKTNLEILKEWWDAFLEENKTAIKTKVGEWGERFDEFMTDLTEDFSYWFKEQKKNAKTWMEEQRVIIGKKLDEWKERFLQWLLVDMPLFWSDAVLEFLKRLTDLFANIAEWFDETGIPEMREHGEAVLANLIAAAAQWIADNVAKIENIGKTIVESIWSGIKSRWDWIHDKVRGFVQGLIDAAKRVLHIVGDPVSLVFLGVGESLVEGMKLGFERELAHWEPQMRADLALGERVEGFGARGGSPITNYITQAAPTYQVNASYARAQTEASIRDDLRMMLALS